MPAACPTCGRPFVPDDGPGQARANDPPTAKAAGAMKVNRGTQRWVVLEAIRSVGSDGATSHELELATHIPYASLTPRIGELKRGGFVITSGFTRPSQYGVEQEVLITPPQPYVIPERQRDLEFEPRELPDPDEYRDLDPRPWYKR